MSHHSIVLRASGSDRADARVFRALDAAGACLSWLATLLLPATLIVSSAQAETYTQVSAGASHTCAIYGSGGVHCWGANLHSQLGNGGFSINGVPTPAAVVGLTDVTMIAAGVEHTCALAGGVVKCWGSNLSGQLGSDGGVEKSVPVTVPGLSSFATQIVAVSVGSGFSCALITTKVTPDYFVRCWGGNAYGQLGAITTGASSSTPVTVTGLSNPLGSTLITGLSTGATHGCVVFASKNIKCWGRNDAGQLGNNASGGFSTTAVSVATITTATAVSAGSGHTCAVDGVNGGAWCWGDGSHGQIGNGSQTASPITSPQVVLGSRQPRIVSAGGEHSCGVTSGGLSCWGSDAKHQISSGQLPNGQSNYTTPAFVTVGADSVLSVSAGAAHTCALYGAGVINCWGDNSYGQLGLGPGFVVQIGSPPSDNVLHALACSLDVDGDGRILATTDMVILTRAALGIGGPELVANATSLSAPRRTATDMVSYLSRSCGMQFQ